MEELFRSPQEKNNSRMEVKHEKNQYCNKYTTYFYYSFLLVINNKKEEININFDSNVDSYIYPDYPLIDIALRQSDSEFVLVIGNNILHPELVSYLYLDDKQKLEALQKVLVVNTFPKGFGTTPDSILYMYKDYELIREYIAPDLMFIEMDKTELELRLGQELPPEI